MNLIQKDEAKDALVKISGFEVSSSTNVIGDAVEGVTINLLKAEVGVKTTLNISFDSSSVLTRSRVRPSCVSRFPRSLRR